MKTIAICNHKGGVGKTALSMAIAEGLHRKGKRTLLVDLDQQMNATQQAKIDTTDEVTVYDLLTSFDYTAKDGIKHFDGGDIIPGDVLVSNAESDMAKLDTRLTMLADAMEGIDDDYDYAIIDCPPSLGLVTRNAMVAADELIVPVIPNRSSLKGFTNIQEQGNPDGKWVYYDTITGQMHHGESCIDGNWYYFDDYTGKMVHGEYQRNGNWYYYDSVTGIMAHGWTTLPNGNRYYYDEVTGIRR